MTTHTFKIKCSRIRAIYNRIVKVKSVADHCPNCGTFYWVTMMRDEK